MSLFPLILRGSGWQYVTAASGGLAIGYVAAGGGSITVRPPGGQDVALYYGGAGGGLGIGAKLPRIPKVNISLKGKTVTGAAEAFPSTGQVYVSDAVGGRDLMRSDFTGPCMYVEVAAGLIAGGSGTAMLFGLSPAWLAAMVAAPQAGAILQYKLLESARGAILMAGINAGLQAGAGVAGYIGALI